MNYLMTILIVGFVGGIAVGLQAPLSSIISQRMGTLQSVFIIHVGGALASLVALVVLGWGKPENWRTVPWYAFGAGAFGLIVISSMTYMIPRVGIASAIIILLAGQLFIGSILDHYGFLGTVQRPLDLMRMAGLAVVFLGVWLAVK